jgi:outer membrane protein TolC
MMAVAALAAAAGARAAERTLSLEEAVALALQNAEGIVIERESLFSAEAAVTGAEGAYDPLLGLEAAWSEGNPPVNSSFSGAPPGRLSPTDETTEARATLDQLLPTGGIVSVRGAGDRATTDGLFGLLSPVYGTQAGVELRQPLLRNRSIDPARFRIRAAEADLDFSAAELRREVSETVAAVEQVYWTLIAARREVEVREEAMGLAQEQLTETEARIETGMAPELEIAQPRAELERRRGELLEAQEGMTRSENTLKLLVLGDRDTDLWGDRIVPSEEREVAVSPIDVNAAMERALASRPEIAALQAVVDRRRAEAALASDAVRPALDAVVSYDRYGLAGTRNPVSAPPPGVPSDVPPALEGDLGQSLELLRDGEFDDKRVALVFAFPIGNRTARAGAEIARSAERQAEADLTRLRKLVRTEVLDATAVLDSAAQRIEAARAAREAAEVQLSSERDRYGAGMSTNFLVLTRQNDLSRARLDEIAAITDYRRARTALARVTGALLEERGIAIQELDEPAAPKEGQS